MSTNELAEIVKQLSDIRDIISDLDSPLAESCRNRIDTISNQYYERFSFGVDVENTF